MPLAQVPISPKLVGIVNITPDSFSDGGGFLHAEDAIKKAYSLTDDGADIIDLGAEATGPKAKPISVDEEWKRLEPVLKVIGRGLVISVDTYKAEIAKRSLELGAQLINDISALRADSKMAEVVAKANCKVILMHSKEDDRSPHVSDSTKSYQDVVADISLFLKERIEFAISKGIEAKNIILDPGLGLYLSKEADISWEVLKRVGEFSSLNLPLLLGVSRKGFLKSLDESSASDRDPLSALIGVHLANNGVSYLRTHNVSMTKKFIETYKCLS